MDRPDAAPRAFRGGRRPAPCRVCRSQCLGEALIYSEKSCLPKAKPSKINTLDSRLCGKDDFFSISSAKYSLEAFGTTLNQHAKTLF
jgi:hypothetical protein